MPTYAPIPSDVPSRASSGPFTENGMDGDATDHSKTEHRRKLLETIYLILWDRRINVITFDSSFLFFARIFSRFLRIRYE